VRRPRAHTTLTRTVILAHVADLRDDVENAAAELAYAAIGFAILGAQRAQVARRQLERCAAMRSLADVAARVARQARSAGTPPRRD